jgi:16S rRNA (adenine1518-N6/adenine1519-N6)-dimethyltransferase
MNDTALPALMPLRDLLRTHELFAKKSFGQHFLLDERILDGIVNHAGDMQNYHVFEIGPGPGGLTRAMLAKGATLTIIEKDSRFLPLLKPLQNAYPNQLHIIEGDALKVNLMEHSPAPRKIVANLPYNVATPLLVKWLHDIAAHGQKAYTQLTLMFQKEVAERIVAAPATDAYGRLAVLTGWLCDTIWNQDLPAGAFTPPPKITSSVITLLPLAKPRFEANLKSLEHVTASAFNQRRKMLRGSLKSLGVDAETLLKNADIDGTKRAEVLDVEAFCRLANAYDALTKSDTKSGNQF